MPSAPGSSQLVKGNSSGLSHSHPVQKVPFCIHPTPHRIRHIALLLRPWAQNPKATGSEASCHC